MERAILLLGTLLVVLGASSPAFACLDGGDGIEFAIDETMVGVDVTPPGAIPEVTLTSLHRGNGGDCKLFGGCSTVSTDDLGWFELGISPPEDDMTPAEAMGYVFEVLEGTVPDGFDISGFEGPVSFPDGGTTQMSWLDERTDDQEAFSFTLGITPLDLAGNEGPTYHFVVEDEGSGGCSVDMTAPSTTPAAPGLLLLLSFVSLVVVRRGQAS